MKFKIVIRGYNIYDDVIESDIIEEKIVSNPNEEVKKYIDKKYENYDKVDLEIIQFAKEIIPLQTK